MEIPHSRPTINEEDISCVVSNLKSGKIATGGEVRIFEKEMSSYIGALGGVAVNSGTNALFLALKALGIKNGDEVVLPSYVCASVMSAVNNTGAKPVLADIESQGYNICPKSAAKKITSRAKAIIVPHMFGAPANLEELLNIGIPIIEDCAQSVGGEYKGRKLGNFGVLSIFSFYATKVLTTGHGGMVLTDSKELLEALEDLTRYDCRPEYRESYNYSMSDFQAALGRSQLRRLGQFIEKRRQIAARYGKILADCGQNASRCDGEIFFRYIIETDSPDKFIEKMGGFGVACAKPVFMPLHNYLGLDEGDFLNTVSAQKKAVSVPIYPSMSEEEIQKVEGSLKIVLGG
jgi:perosamine synthetase